MFYITEERLHFKKEEGQETQLNMATVTEVYYPTVTKNKEGLTNPNTIT